MSGSTSQSTLELILKAIDHASPTLGKIAGAMQKQGVQAGVAAAVTSKAFGLAGEALHKVIDAIGDSVNAYREQEVAQARLGASLNANVHEWKANAGAIKEANEASVALGFTDTAATNSMAILVAATHNVEDATRALATARDLARFKGISLEEASQALVKVEGGQYRMLKSLGIQLPKNATAVQALAAVTQVAGGQARAYAETDLGKEAIAYAKVEEAQERFGKGLSKIESAVIPAAADAVGILGDAFQLLNDEMSKNQPVTEKVDDVLTVLNALGGQSLPIIGGMVGQLQALSDAEHKAAEATATHGDELIGARTGFRELGLAETQAHPPAETLKDDLHKIASAADLANDALDGMTKTVEDSLFGKAITAGNEARLKENIADLIDQGKHVKEGSLKWIELTGEIAKNRQELFDLHLTQAAKTGPEAAVKFLEQQKAKFGDASGAIARLITQYKALIIVQGQLLKGLQKVDAGRYAGKTVPLFAAGGFAPPGQPAIVGEAGPELIVPRGQGVDVVPQSMWGNYSPGGGGSSGGGTPAEIVIQLDGHEVARFVDRRLYLALNAAGGSRVSR